MLRLQIPGTTGFTSSVFTQLGTFVAASDNAGQITAVAKRIGGLYCVDGLVRADFEYWAVSPLNQ